MFTPATKAAAGDHDENIDMTATETLIGADLAHKVKEITIRIYEDMLVVNRVHIPHFASEGQIEFRDTGFKQRD